MGNKTIINKIYHQLLQEYHPQGWWPVTSDDKSTAGKAEYHPNDYSYPKTEKQKLEIIFGAILTQNTSWKNVEKAIFNLYQNNLINISNVLAIERSKLAELIKSSGYNNQKAERLKIVCKFLLEKPLLELDKISTEKLRDILLSIKGIGPETADSILLYAFNRPVFVIDTYTKRIFSRIGLCSKDVKYDELQQLFMDNLMEDYKMFQEYHALIVEHAKRCCTAKGSEYNCTLIH